VHPVFSRSPSVHRRAPRVPCGLPSLGSSEPRHMEGSSMTKIRKLAGAGVLALTIALVAVACSSNSSSSSSAASGGGFQGDALTGAGATFPDPIYEQWCKDFPQVETSAKINYQGIGTSAERRG